jgi:hypothetical protein
MLEVLDRAPEAGAARRLAERMRGGASGLSKIDPLPAEQEPFLSDLRYIHQRPP